MEIILQIIGRRFLEIIIYTQVWMTIILIASVRLEERGHHKP